MTCDCIWGAEIKHSYLWVLQVNSYTKDEPNFPLQNNLILQKKVSGVDKVLNFKDFLWPNREIKYFSRN